MACGGPELKAIARDLYREVKKWPAAERNRLCVALWKGGTLEEGALVCYVYRRFAKDCGEAEFRMFERWLDGYVGNWAHCDGLSSWLLNACVANRPELSSELVAWTRSRNRWKRRAAAVTMVPEARNGRQIDRIHEIAAELYCDADDMVQKGVGWLLKETYPKHPQQVMLWIRKWKGSAPRSVLRYAAEKMTPADRAETLARVADAVN